MQLLPDLYHVALFLDVDGTLAPITQRPQAVELPRSTLRLLEQLNTACNGSLALVSGRDLLTLRRLCHPTPVALIAEHGICMEDQDSQVLWSAEPELGGFEQLEQALQSLLLPYPKAWLERKTLSFALHYKLCPEAGPTLERKIQEILQLHPHYTLLAGKAVLECIPKACDKGVALAKAHQLPVFSGKIPIMVGDDLTDEPAFNYVNQQQGISIRVGPQNSTSHATYQLEDSDKLLSLLGFMLAKHACRQAGSSSNNYAP
ncbi:trehalose-phosphatase [Alcaligenes endophyticus]|uniref:Trehalose 6-phosphate phosphatase n=1 Tax=Alcaligenes endophyticus TaxID=1929088 RepID=A0ABT8EMA2_9BURK|nr:trehalose-phosphatase [Alcaligenes endophyticus]MCX5591008.1 trehalose-phosphatase [Alcaligenes endophyticus]MDN4122415.1 trehalose-phosphatase [Alcaligenes endophyticus]